jgi:GH15 family glucan-1,4-alpha-glucosidase
MVSFKSRILQRLLKSLLGGSELEEIELDHLDGHKGSRPVRIGNGAANHVQLVTYIFHPHLLLRFLI